MANILGFIVTKWRLLAVVLGGILLLIVLFAVGSRVYHVFNPPPKLNEKQIVKAQKAIETDDRQTMVQVLAESDTAEHNIDSNIKLAEQAVDDAKKNYDGLSNQQLADELNKRASQQ